MSVRWSTSLELESGSDEPERRTDEGWLLVDADDWWRTSFTSVSWSFQEQHLESRVALPPYFRLLSTPPRSKPQLDAEAVSLNPDLVGFRLAAAAVAPYEKAVGFAYAPSPTIEKENWGLPPPLNLSYTEEDVVDSRDRWKEAVEELLSADSDGSSSLSSSMTDSARSEHSGESFVMPATPVTKASYANVLLKHVSPSNSISDDPHTASPSKTLNAFASSFVPSTEASGLSSFTFPTLNPPNKSTTRLTTVKIKKDDQGFFTDVQVEDKPQSLPSFLQEPSPRRRTRISKTREIVDRLRSSQADNLAKCISHSPSPIFHDLSFIQPRLSVSEDGGDRDRESILSTPSFDEDEEGWIDVGVEVHSPTKAKRARDLFLALTRRRTDSTSSEPSKDEAQGYSALNSDGWIEGIPPNDPPPPPPSLPTKPTFTPSPPKTTRKKHHAQKSSTSSSIPSVSPTMPTFPPYMGVPILSPPHMALIPVTPTPAPVAFFFTPPISPYHAMPIPFATAPTSFLGSAFASVPLHPMTTGYVSKRSMNSLYPNYHPAPRKSTSSHGIFGKPA